MTGNPFGYPDAYSAAREARKSVPPGRSFLMAPEWPDVAPGPVPRRSQAPVAARWPVCRTRWLPR